ncbi:MAG: hypothetical protein N2559_15350 [Anaerolineae bacterium]|nr:hypothetical protein [Anaerolineae bacterium]
MFAHRFVLLASVLCSVVGCSTLPIPLPFATPLPPNTLVYTAPTTLTIKAGATLPGTTLVYLGENENKQAQMIVSGYIAPKQVADTVDWQGSPVPNVNLKLTTRVASFDKNAITLVGTAHIEVANIVIQPGGTPGAAMLEFSAPVTWSLKKDELIPGTKIVYVGAAPEGAQFLGLEGYPYRKQLDSLQYLGRISPKVFLRLDLRVVSFSENNVVLGGTANIRIEQ